MIPPPLPPRHRTIPRLLPRHPILHWRTNHIVVLILVQPQRISLPSFLRILGLIVLILLQPHLLRPLDVVRQRGIRKPVPVPVFIDAVRGLDEPVGPAFGKVPVDGFFEMVDHEIWMGGESRGVGFMLHDLHLGAVEFDLSRVSASCWVVRVGGTDVGDFEHHVAGVWVLETVPEGDADVLHAVSAQVGILEEVWMDGDFADVPCIIWDPAC